MMFARRDLSKRCAMAAFATLGLAATAGDAFAQRANKPGSPGRITLENKRAATLTELKIIAKEGTAAERVIATNLAPGKKIAVTRRRGSAAYSISPAPTTTTPPSRSQMPTSARRGC